MTNVAPETTTATDPQPSYSNEHGGGQSSPTGGNDHSGGNDKEGADFEGGEGDNSLDDIKEVAALPNVMRLYFRKDPRCELEVPENV